ncbi:hypothetical protein ACFVXE_22795 [Streptomyces sp. NPDC058231]
MAARTVGLNITGARPPVFGTTLVDITLTDRSSPAARPVGVQ